MLKEVMTVKMKKGEKVSELDNESHGIPVYETHIEFSKCFTDVTNHHVYIGSVMSELLR